MSIMCPYLDCGFNHGWQSYTGHPNAKEDYVQSSSLFSDEINTCLSVFYLSGFHRIFDTMES